MVKQVHRVATLWCLAGALGLVACGSSADEEPVADAAVSDGVVRDTATVADTSIADVPLPEADLREADFNAAGDVPAPDGDDTTTDPPDVPQVPDAGPVPAPWTLRGSQEMTPDLMFSGEPPDPAPSCPARIDLKTDAEIAPGSFHASLPSSPLFEPLPALAVAFETTGPPAPWPLDGSIDGAYVFPAPDGSGLFVHEPTGPAAATRFHPKSSDGGGFDAAQSLTTLGLPWDAMRCLGVFELGGDANREELVCIHGDELVVFHGLADGGWSADQSQRTEIPTTGGHTVTPADLNGDGAPELLLAGGEQVLCQTGDLVFEECSEAVGMPMEAITTFMMVVLPCDPSEAGSDLCLYKMNNGTGQERHFLRVVRGAATEANPYGFTLERFDPTGPTSGPDSCDKLRAGFCEEWLGLACPGWLMENFQAYLDGNPGGEADTPGVLDGSGFGAPMGIGCGVFRNAEADVDQLCCMVALAQGPGADGFFCHQGDSTWRHVSGIGLTKARNVNGRLARGWPVRFGSVRPWTQDVLLGNGWERNPETQSDGFTNIFGSVLGSSGLLPGYKDFDVEGPSLAAYYARLPNGAFESLDAAVSGLETAGEIGTFTDAWLDVDGTPRLHLVIGEWTGGFQAYRLTGTTRFVRLRLRGDQGSDLNGLAARVEVKEPGGDGRCVSFVGTESSQMLQGQRLEVVCAVGGAETVDVTVRWAPSKAHPGGHSVDYQGVPADSKAQLLWESGAATPR